MSGPHDELRQTYLTLFALGWIGRLTPEDKLLLISITAERTRRIEGRSPADRH